MRVRDFLLLVLICLIWASNNVLSKIIVDDWAVPPIFYAALRFAVVALVMFPWLLPMPRPAWRIILIGLLMGGGNFALLFVGLQTTSPSAAAIILQLGVPFTILLSMVMLGERVHWRRGIGIGLTLVGVLIVIWRPAGITLSAGLWFVAAAAFAGSAGAVLMKRVTDVTPLRFQAWVGLVSVISLTLCSLLFEQGQWPAATAAGWPLAAAVLFTALIVSVGAHSAYYHLINNYEANLLAPLTLITPLATIALGVWITNDDFDLRMGIGAALAIGGVLIVALRRKPATELLVDREQR
ncbi:DMT family transporter [Parasphingorhabdus flavimaris]|uniref:DMT family transporter n=1 Tax=Parasphingorhabdus flavimaris TaxID=266812 RepID=A0ABX2MYN1_9SPHN|nr:DMT family transporter [Parasphingorhabdus flavimaris]NVD26551.1 DMT family transporter [Parasphingorhabdus flavimaris]|tara:strand:+ start:2625 stop:3512 length:888 start_codon:yes stop_codon:yes gene_type:complete